MSSILADSVETDAIEGIIPRAWVPARILSILDRRPEAVTAGLSIMDQAIVSGTSFITAAIVGRTTSPEQLGLYYVVLSIVLIVSNVQDQVVTGPYTVYSKRRKGRELAEYAGSMWLHHFALTAVTVVGLLAAIAVVSAVGSTNILPGLWALVIAAPLVLLRETVRRFTFAALQLRAVIVLDAVVSVVQLGALALLGYWGMLSLLSIFLVMGGACGLACVVWLLTNPPRIRWQRERFFADWRRNWGFGKWALRSYLVGNTTSYVMLWILSIAVGTAAGGVLGACATLVGATNLLVMGVANILMPKAAQAFVTHGTKELRRMLWQAGGLVTLTLGGFCLLVLLTGDLFPVLVFGADYEGSGGVFLALALVALMNGIGVVTGNGLWAIDQPRANFVADVCCMSVTLVAAALLVLPFEELGAALATLAGAATAAVVRLITLLVQLGDEATESGAASHAFAVGERH